MTGSSRWNLSLRVAWLLAGVLALGSFLLSWQLESRLDRLGVFAQYNVLFDADPIEQIESFSEGSNRAGRNLVHFNLANYVHPPVRLGGRVAVWTGAASVDDEAQIRRQIALWVVPTASALKLLVVFGTFLLLDFSPLRSLLLAVLSGVSFSQAIFGSIPEHWALSGLVLAATFWLAADLVRRGGQIRWLPWALVGALAFGITVTNLVLVVLVFTVALLVARPGLLAATTAGIRLSLFSTASAILYFLGAAAVSGVSQRQTPAALGRWVGRHTGGHFLEQLQRFPSAVANSIAPPKVDTAPNSTGLRVLGESNEFQFTLETSPGVASLQNIPGMLLLVAVVTGAVSGIRASRSQRALALAAIAVLVFNGVFHAHFGSELFLYSQHYQLAVVVLLSGLMTGGGRRASVGTVVVAATVLAVAVNTGLRVDAMLAMLEAHQ